MTLTGFRQLRLFSLFGFEVKLDLSWLLLALLISWTLGAGYFPTEYPDLPRSVYAWMGIAGAVGVFFSIVWHEFSHSMVARHFGMRIRGITLFVFGGVAEMEAEPPSPKSEFLMAIAGPISSFVLAGVFWTVGQQAVASAWPVPVIGVCSALALINLTVAIFNLMPAFPLDGGRMLRATLWHLKNDLRSATFISSQIGRGFGLALMILGVIAFLGGDVIGGMWAFLIGIFVRGAAASSFQQTVLKDVIEDHPVREFMRPAPVTVPPAVSVQDWLDDYVYRHHFKMFPVVDGENLLGCITVESIRSVAREDWGTTTVRELMAPSSDENTIPADTDTSTLLTDMVNPDKPSRYMVVDKGRLVGMISLKDLLELISLKLQIESRG